MRTIADLTDAIRVLCPIDGVAGDLANKAGLRIDYRPEATPEQRAAARAAIDAFDPSYYPPGATGSDFLTALLDTEAATAKPRDLLRLAARGQDRVPLANPVVQRIAARAGITAADWFARMPPADN